MRIGILTLPLHTNYGGILQAYALQTVLERMGHEVEVIDQERRKFVLPLHKRYFVYAKRLIEKYLLRKNIHVFLEDYNKKITPIIETNTRRFIVEYIKTRKYSCLSEIDEKDYDAIIVGSDQIWRPMYFNEDAKENAFLYFTKDWKQCRRIAYAPSFGSEMWEYSSLETYRIKEIIRKFSYLSVREEAGKTMCAEYFGCEAEVVLDPTLLLRREDYLNLINSCKTPIPHKNDTLLVYILDMNGYKKDIIKKISTELNLEPYYVSSMVENPTAKLKDRIQKPVESWLSGFCDAKYVITDSFHACVFSIIFNKPFAVIPNSLRGISRFETLLRIFGIEDRVVKNNIIPYSSINWELLNQKWSSEAANCIYKLKVSLS